MEHLYHTTKEGDVIAIVSMEDTHLLNTINLLLRNTRAAKQYLENPTKKNSVVGILYGLDSVSTRKKAEKIIQYSYEVLPRYLIVVITRGLYTPELLSEIRDVFGCGEPQPLLEEFEEY
jgi:hypothetical protein